MLQLIYCMLKVAVFQCHDSILCLYVAFLMSPPNQQRKHGDGMVTLYNGERQLDCNKSNGGHADRQVYPRVYQVGKRFLECKYRYVCVIQQIVLEAEMYYM